MDSSKTLKVGTHWYHKSTSMAIHQADLVFKQSIENPNEYKVVKNVNMLGKYEANKTFDVESVNTILSVATHRVLVCTDDKRVLAKNWINEVIEDHGNDK
ncbi:hypothetical protein SP15_098 [Bacillus phage SP-15]|uniref:Uncharacterized protein n=1 Tax=Bacillus phage SP-15 TaxID=1792032 RepID=A0A127AWD8_9CAUD|nr:hypothetical protein SP15_098 [Bacillus phage SP-15]AMM44897.1 hypothetical protein SP15_098 [Bacillus phage SP-15]